MSDSNRLTLALLKEAETFSQHPLPLLLFSGQAVQCDGHLLCITTATLAGEEHYPPLLFNKVSTSQNTQGRSESLPANYGFDGGVRAAHATI